MQATRSIKKHSHVHAHLHTHKHRHGVDVSAAKRSSVERPWHAVSGVAVDLFRPAAAAASRCRGRRLLSGRRCADGRGPAVDRSAKGRTGWKMGVIPVDEIMVITSNSFGQEVVKFRGGAFEYYHILHQIRMHLNLKSNVFHLNPWPLVSPVDPGSEPSPARAARWRTEAHPRGSGARV